MENNTVPLIPSLCLDFKKNRIRFHKCTLDLIGNPEYIQMFVNPETGKIAVKKGSRNDHLSHRIYKGSGHTTELYSINLAENLIAVSEEVSCNRCYRLYGTYDARRKMIYFSMKNPVPMEGE